MNSSKPSGGRGKPYILPLSIWNRTYCNILRKLQHIPWTYPRPSTTCVFWDIWGMFPGPVWIFLEISNIQSYFSWCPPLSDLPTRPDHPFKSGFSRNRLAKNKNLPRSRQFTLIHVAVSLPFWRICEEVKLGIVKPEVLVGQTNNCKILPYSIGCLRLLACLSE